MAQLGSGGTGWSTRPRTAGFGGLSLSSSLPDEFAREPEALNRFRREARAASALNYPNFCTIS